MHRLCGWSTGMLKFTQGTCGLSDSSTDKIPEQNSVEGEDSFSPETLGKSPEILTNHWYRLGSGNLDNLLTGLIPSRPIKNWILFVPSRSNESAQQKCTRFYISFITGWDRIR